jgi:hypothetical protein
MSSELMLASESVPHHCRHLHHTSGLSLVRKKNQSWIILIWKYGIINVPYNYYLKMKKVCFWPFNYAVSSVYLLIYLFIYLY